MLLHLRFIIRFVFKWVVFYFVFEKSLKKFDFFSFFFRPSMRELLLHEFFAEDTGFKLELVNRENLVESSDSMVNFRLRITDQVYIWNLMWKMSTKMLTLKHSFFLIKFNASQQKIILRLISAMNSWKKLYCWFAFFIGSINSFSGQNTTC